MLSIEKPTESTASSFRARVLVTHECIHLLALKGEPLSAYYYRCQRLSEVEERGVAGAFFLMPEAAFPYSRVQVLVDSSDSYVLVPQDFIRRGVESADWLVRPVAEHSRPFSIPIGDLGYTLLYTLPTEVYDFCVRSFVISHPDHPVRPMLGAGVRRSRGASGVYMTVLLSEDEGYVDVVVASDGQTLHANRYKVRSEVDVLYYVTSIWRRHQMESPRDSLYLYGNETHTITSALLPLITPAITSLHINDYSLIGSDGGVYKEIKVAHPTLPPSLIYAELS